MRAVIFDLGHTLIDYHSDWKGPEDRAVSRIYRLLVSRVGRLPAEKDFSADLHRLLEIARQKKQREMIEVPLRTVLTECFRRLGYENDEGTVEAGLEVFYGTLLEDRRLIDGAREMLASLKGRCSLGLISDVAWGLPSEYPLRDMHDYAIDGFFDDMVFSTDVGLRKPHPRIFKISLDNLSVSNEEAVYVGNSLQADIKGALNVGIRSILKRSSYYFPDDSIVPDAIIDDWSELEGALSDLG